MITENDSIIYVRDLPLDIEIGLNDDEKNRRQRVIVTVEARIDTPPVFTADTIQDTLDFDYLVNGIRELTAREPVGLVETLAEWIAELVLADRHVRSVTVDIEKREVFGDAAKVGVRLRRRRTV